MRPETSSTPITARQSFTWAAGGAFLVRHITVDHPDFPNAVAVLGLDTYYYFDSRGVVRTFKMNLKEGAWTLQREDPDFWQRFIGNFGPDGNTIAGRWEMSHDRGVTWKHDFEMAYTKVVTSE